MRHFCTVSFVLLIATGVNLAENVLNKNEVLTTENPKNSVINKYRSKRDSHAHVRRGQRQVGYFETSGENVCDNEFVSQDIRGDIPGHGLREDEKFENDAECIQNPLDQEGQNGPGGGSLAVEGDVDENPKFQRVSVSDDLESDDLPFRTERQTRRFESSGEVLRGPDKPEVNKNFINLLRWNKNKEMISDLFQPGTQKNEAYPVNDDIADFAVYMNKTKKKKGRAKSGPIVNTDTLDRKYGDLGEEVEQASDYSGMKHPLLNSNRQNLGPNLNIRSDIYSQNTRKIKKDTSYIGDNLLFPSEDSYTWDRNVGNANNLRHSSYESVGSLIKGASVNEADSDQSDIVEQSQDRSSSVVGEVVREKVITLPEPLVFNSSHVVSSFVYTMIPFRSPLLNLLENDKHSKYIMIKIDPVLQPSKRISVSDPQLKADVVEYTLEKNVMKVIQKLIGSDFQWDLTSVEGHPRSKQKYKVMNSRYYRKLNEETAAHNSSSPQDRLKHFNGVIS